jgi:hypothetical protein
MRVFISLAILLTAAPIGAQSPEPGTVADDTPVIEEVLISGEQPGPGLWSASRNGKTVWILGMHGPLPTKMTWRSREVETRIAEAQVVVRWVSLETDFEVGFFSRLAAVPAVMTLGDNLKGVTLKDQVTPEAYAQWQTLKAKYIRRGSAIEKLRPAFAASALRTQAMSATGLSSPQSEAVVWPVVRLIAKKHKVEILQPEVRMSIQVDKPRAAIKSFREARLGDEECFAKSLARLEDDLVAMKTNANAWAKGDLDVLRRIPPPDPSTDCVQLVWSLLLSGSLIQETNATEIGDLQGRARIEIERGLNEINELWLRTVEGALRDHSSVFALVPISALFDAHGPLAALRERGYAVVEP